MERPLADEIRPQSLDEVVGQRHILGENGLLRHLAALDAPREPVMEQLSLFDGPGGGVP